MLFNPNVCSAQLVDFYFGGALTDQTQPFTQSFALTSYTPSYLNSIVSATLTSISPGSPANATITAQVYLTDTASTGFIPVEVANETLTLDLSTPTASTQSTSTAGYPTTYLPGPSGNFNEVIVDVTGSNFTNAAVSFSGATELSDAPEPSTVGMMLGGLGALGACGRRRWLAGA
jgi:hypothetical protein